MTNPQTLQVAINGATNAHTGLHQALHELRHGSVTEAKQILARQIAGKSECADAAVGLQVQEKFREQWEYLGFALLQRQGLPPGILPLRVLERGRSHPQVIEVHS
jgi:hypothetical protein